MKSFNQFLTEAVNISGDFNGNLYINGQEPQQESVGEEFIADVVWQGKLYRMELAGIEIPTRESLGEQIQDEYPGAVVHNIYPAQYKSNSAL
jgi:hypothetical protein